MKGNKTIWAVILLAIAALVWVAPSVLYTKYISSKVKSDIEIIDYPFRLILFPGEIENFNITLQNSASENYCVRLDFSLGNVTYQDNYVTFGNKVYNVAPGQQKCAASLMVESNAPPLNTSLSVDLCANVDPQTFDSFLVIKHWPIDVGGFSSGIVTFIILLLLYDKGLLKTEEDTASKEQGSRQRPLRYLFFVPLTIALWIAIRLSLFRATRFFSSDYVFGSYDIYSVFDIVASLLAAYLCLTLMTQMERQEIIKWMKIVQRAVLIAIMTFVPRYNSPYLLPTIGGTAGFVSILLAFSVTVIILTYAAKAEK